MDGCDGVGERLEIESDEGEWRLREREREGVLTTMMGR